MFRDSAIKIAGFDSCPDSERSVSDGSCQTVDLKTLSQGTQTSGASSIGAQAASEEAGQNAVNAQAYDTDKLLKFLNRILPHLEEELKHNEDNLNFDDPLGGMEERGDISLEMLPIWTTIQPDFCKDKIISDLTWNASETLLAVASSEKSHEGWCCHESSVGIYHTGKNKFEKNPPGQLLKQSACVRCIRFHPVTPDVLAVGLHSGQVVICEVFNERVFRSDKKGSGDEWAHVDVVTCLTWKKVGNDWWLITTGRDGKIIFWTVDMLKETYEPYQRLLILKHHLTTAAGPDEHLEVLHVSFWFEKESDFVVAAGGGSIFHCTLAAAKDLPSFPGYKDPVRMKYKSHKGIVTYVSCGASGQFASCGTDGEIHVYKSETNAPLFVFHTNRALLGIEWTTFGLISWGCSFKIECRKIGEFDATTVCDVPGGASAVAVASRSFREFKLGVGSRTGEILILRKYAV